MLAVGAVNPYATDPNAIRRVSYFTEWRPPTLDPVDKIYRAYDGILNGARFVNDDDDERSRHAGNRGSTRTSSTARTTTSTARSTRTSPRWASRRSPA